MLLVVLFFMLLGATLAYLLYKYMSNKKLVIRFSVSWIDWVIPIMMAFTMVLFSFFIEALLSFWLIKIINENGIGYYVVAALNNGLLIIGFVLLMSFVFGKLVEISNLDYLELYSDVAAKMCFSILVVFFCVRVILFAQNELCNYRKEITNHVFMWLLTVVGTWIGIGFGCQGRFITKEGIESKVTFRDKCQFWRPILLLSVGASLLLFVPFDVYNSKFFLPGILAMSFAFVIVSIILLNYLKNRINPSIKKSEKEFERISELYENGENAEIIKARFGRMSYKLKEGMLEIDKTDIEDKFCIDYEEFNRLFGEDIYKFGDCIEKAREYLEKRYNDQKKYINDGFERCIKEQENNRLNKMRR